MRYISWLLCTLIFTVGLTGAGLWCEAQIQGLPQASVKVTEPASQLSCVVSGAVISPGIQTLGLGATVADALKAAGGPLSEAHLSALQLDAPVESGQMIHVPHLESSSSMSESKPIMNPVQSKTTLSLNQASVQELDQLPGVGPALAERIVAHRQKHGAFRSLRGLLEVKGIGEKKWAKLQGELRL